MANIPPTNLQDVVVTLERYKRHAGRQYNKDLCGDRPTLAIYWIHEYNSTENQIRMLCDLYGCKRNTKPYKLSMNCLDSFELANVD